MKKIIFWMFMCLSLFWYGLSSQAIDNESIFEKKVKNIENILPWKIVNIVENAADSYTDKIDDLNLTIWQKNILTEKITTKIDTKIESINSSLAKTTDNQKKDNIKLIINVLELLKNYIILENDYEDYYTKTPSNWDNYTKTQAVCELKNITREDNAKDISDFVSNCQTYQQKWKIVEWLGGPAEPDYYIMSDGNIYGSSDYDEEIVGTSCEYKGYSIPLVDKNSEKTLGFKFNDFKTILQKSKNFNWIVIPPMHKMSDFVENAQDMKLWWGLVKWKNYVFAVKRFEDMDDDSDIYYNVNWQLYEDIWEFEFKDDDDKFEFKDDDYEDLWNLEWTFIEESPWAFIDFNDKGNLIVAKVKSARIQWKEVIHTIQKCELQK